MNIKMQREGEGLRIKYSIRINRIEKEIQGRNNFYKKM